MEFLVEVFDFLFSYIGLVIFLSCIFLSVNYYPKRVKVVCYVFLATFILGGVATGYIEAHKETTENSIVL